MISKKTIRVVLIPYMIYIKIKQITKVWVAADVRCHSSDVVAPPIGVVAAWEATRRGPCGWQAGTSGRAYAIGILGGGWINPIETYKTKMRIFPNFRGENKTYLSCHHLVISLCQPAFFYHHGFWWKKTRPATLFNGRHAHDYIKHLYP